MRLVAAQINARFITVIELLDLSVFRNIDHHRPGTSRAGDVISLGDRTRNFGRFGHLEIPFRNRHRHADRIGLLEGVRSEQSRRHLPGNADDRRRVEHRVGDPGHQVRSARAGRSQANAHLAGGARITLRGMYGALFVARENVIQPIGMMVQMIVNRDYLTARVTEYRIGSFGYKRQ